MRMSRKQVKRSAVQLCEDEEICRRTVPIFVLSHHMLQYYGYTVAIFVLLYLILRHAYNTAPIIVILH